MELQTEIQSRISANINKTQQIKQTNIQLQSQQIRLHTRHALWDFNVTMRNNGRIPVYIKAKGIDRKHRTLLSLQRCIMSNLIIVHYKLTSKPVIVNIEHITSIEDNYIRLVSNDTLNIEETAEQVIALIKKCFT